MDILKIHENYWFYDGPIKSFHLDIQNNIAEIELSAKRIAPGNKNKPVTFQGSCILRLTFLDLIEVSLFDKFPTDGYYIGCCLGYDEEHVIILSFNVHDKSSYVYEKDNWVIKAKQIIWKEV
jgi:hypothetical protein